MTSGSGNLLGAFTFGQHMLGAEPSAVVEVGGPLAAQVVAESQATGSLDRSVALLARPTGDAAVAADLGVHVLRGERVEAAAETDGRLNVALLLHSQVASGDATASGALPAGVRSAEGGAQGASAIAGQFEIFTIPPSPIIGEAVVEARTHAQRIGTATADGEATTRARLTSALQDLPDTFIHGNAIVLGEALTAVALRSTSDGSASTTGFTSQAAPFAGRSRAEGTAAMSAILLLNDSGLVTAQAFVEGFLDRRGSLDGGQSNGVAAARGMYSRASDLEARVLDAYAGVGKWFEGGFFRMFHFDYSLTMAPIPDSPEHAGQPGDAVQHGRNFNDFRVSGQRAADHKTIDSRINGHVWDGTYEEWTAQDVPGLDLSQFPELIDPESGRPYPRFPGPLRRKYQLLAPGYEGTWMVDTRGPGFIEKALRADSVGEARFDEPQSSVDMDLELKSSMRGRPRGESAVTAAALLLTFRSLVLLGNVAVVRTFLRVMEGNAAKSPEPLLPITRTTTELIAPVKQTTHLYV